MDRHFDSLPEGLRTATGRIAALGVFDGVHRGHARILGEAIRWARETRVPALALTFSTHPDAIIRGAEPRFIVSVTRRIEILESLGFDATVLLPFNEQIARLPARRFAEEFLGRGLALTGVVVGANFRFGHRAEGDVDLLRRLGETGGFEVRVLEAVRFHDEIISSSLVRKEVEAGNVENAEAMLGRPFHLRGRVVLGQRRGRTLGFPTVNLAPDTLLRPAKGVYATLLERSGGRAYPSVTNVGVCPTFGAGAPLTVETHILDFDEEIYGEEVGVAFHQRLRGEERFPTPAALVDQIARDIARARERLGRGASLTDESVTL